MATSPDKIVSNDLNNLFAKLEAVRSQQLSAVKDLTADQRTALSTAFNTEIAVSGEKNAANQIQQLQNNVSTLTNSYNISSSFVSSIAVPSVGSLLKAANMNDIITVIDNVAAACQNCTNNSTNFNATNSTCFCSTDSTQGTNGTNFFVVFRFASGFVNKCGGNPQSQYLYNLGLI